MGYCAGLYRISIHAPHARSDHECNFYDRAHGYFNPRSSCEERRLRSRSGYLRRHFNPRSSCEERPPGKLLECADLPISIHAPHARSDSPLSRESRGRYEFQSTLLMRGATGSGGGRHRRHDISIHAPHARSDRQRRRPTSQARYFNPRSSCEERPRRQISCGRSRNFNPRSSCEERRRRTGPPRGRLRFQSTLLMRGATTVLTRQLRREVQISIHAPHARSDSRVTVTEPLEKLFQSTLLMRGATGCCDEAHRRHDISIHAPHARSDGRSPLGPTFVHHFNPRSSCEERLYGDFA